LVATHNVRLGRRPIQTDSKRLGALGDCCGVTEASRLALAGQLSPDMGFEEFFRAQYPTLCRALVLLTGDGLEAQDLAQEALVRVYERWERVGEMGSPGGYLYRVALNLQRKRVKRRSRPVLLGPAVGGGADPAEVIETRTEVARMLGALPIGQRQALVLVEWLGLDVPEAARVLGIEAASVRVRVHRAKTTLRDQFGVADE
jgi:RNA polymerase sigma factor (sigma-70 family)